MNERNVWNEKAFDHYVKIATIMWENKESVYNFFRNTGLKKTNIGNVEIIGDYAITVKSFAIPELRESIASFETKDDLLQYFAAFRNFLLNNFYKIDNGN
jgi:hypothetical protein